MIIPKEAVKSPSPKIVQKSQTKWVKYLTVLVLLGAVGMTLLWWWQDYQKEQESREHIVSSSTIEQAVQASAPTSAAVEVPAVPVAPAPVIETPKAEAVTPMPTENSAANTVVAAEQAQVSQNPETTTEAVNVLQQPTATETPAEQPQAAAIGNDELRIEITGKESWITVKGNKSKKSLAEKLYSNGEVLTFNGDEQYRLTIGAPANVKLYYKGQEVPLKIDGRVARIKLPLAQ